MLLNLEEATSRRLIIDAVHASERSDGERLDRLAQWVTMCHAAQDVLRSKGYGVAEMDILETAREVPDRTETGRYRS